MPSHDSSEGAPLELVRAEFAKRLKKILIQKGWNQSELARRVQESLPEGEAFGRHLVSTWIRGTALPMPHNFEALRKVLRVKREDLMPLEADRSPSDSPAFDMRDVGDGNVWLRINQTTDFGTGAQIMALLHAADATKRK